MSVISTSNPFLRLTAASLLLMLAACQSMPTSQVDSELGYSNDIVIAAAQEDMTDFGLTLEELVHPLELPNDPTALDFPKTEKNIWIRIQNGLQLEVPQNQRMIVQRDWYARHQGYLNRVANRAKPFLYDIVEEIEARDMPMELALLPIVESAFDPFAYSHGRASGMWQFIPGTGKRFGLKQNWWYDGRRDVYASTRAALDYLTYLHDFFDGNWLHALAAYNSGEGNVRRAIRNNKRKNKPTDFWNLKLPRETKAYVPKLLALADLLARDDEFALNWKPIKNAPYLEKVNIGSQLDLALAANLADMTVEEVYRYNPGFNRWSTPPKGPHYLLLPLEHVAQFKAGLASTAKQDRVRWLRYTIRSGDSLSTIARRHNTTVTTLRSVNSINGTRITAGDTLLIPTASQSQQSYTLSSDRRLAKKQNTPRGGNKQVYTVRSGDSFWKISRQFGVTHRNLAKWNGMAPTDPLKVGKKLVIWTKSPVVANAPAENVALQQQQRLRKINYRVRQGDSFARISNKFAVSIRDLKRWNEKISQRKYLQPGDRITLYVDITNQSGGN